VKLLLIKSIQRWLNVSWHTVIDWVNLTALFFYVGRCLWPVWNVSSPHSHIRKYSMLIRRHCNLLFNTDVIITVFEQLHRALAGLWRNFNCCSLWLTYECPNFRFRHSIFFLMPGWVSAFRHKSQKICILRYLFLVFLSKWWWYFCQNGHNEICSLI
jgi:hypothetical protein